MGFGTPPVCVSNSPIVTESPYGDSDRYRTIGSSSAICPRSTSCNTAAAVMVLLIEYAIMVVAGSIGAPRRRSDDPAVKAATVALAFTATYWMPGAFDTSAHLLGSAGAHSGRCDCCSITTRPSFEPLGPCRHSTLAVGIDVPAVAERSCHTARHRDRDDRLAAMHRGRPHARHVLEAQYFRTAEMSDGVRRTRTQRSDQAIRDVVHIHRLHPEPCGNRHDPRAARERRQEAADEPVKLRGADDRVRHVTRLQDHFRLPLAAVVAIWDDVDPDDRDVDDMADGFVACGLRQTSRAFHVDDVGPRGVRCEMQDRIDAGNRGGNRGPGGEIAG